MHFASIGKQHINNYNNQMYLWCASHKQKALQHRVIIIKTSMQLKN